MVVSRKYDKKEQLDKRNNQYIFLLLRLAAINSRVFSRKYTQTTRLKKKNLDKSNKQYILLLLRVAAINSTSSVLKGPNSELLIK